MGDVRVAPLHLRDDLTDVALVTGLLERLGAGHAQVVGGAGPGGRRWLDAVAALVTAAVDTLSTGSTRRPPGCCAAGARLGAGAAWW